MNTETGSLTNTQGHTIFTQAWLPEGDIRAVLVVAHGLSEHCGRYLPFIEHFVAQDYAVYALDHQGHGRSEGKKGHIPSFSVFVETLHQYITGIQEQHPGQKTFLVGHSMGGLISTHFLIKHQGLLAGCVLSGAALDTEDVITPFQAKLLKLCSLIIPEQPIIAIEGADVSRDPKVVEAYLNDPLVYRGKATSKLLSEIVSSAGTALKQAGNITLPMLILHGGDDKLAHHRGSEQLYSTIASEDKTLTIYDGLYHEIFLEEEKLDVFKDVETWLDKQLCRAD